MNCFAFEENLSVVRRVNSGQNFSQRAFTRAIFTNQRVTTAASDFKTHAVQREHAREAFRDIFE